MAEQSKSHYATFWQRTKAALIDFLILLPVWIFLIGFYDPFNPTPNTYNSINQALGSLTSTILFLAYSMILLVEYKGQTVGMRVVGIRVVMEDESKITYGKAFLRSIGDYVSTAVFGLGYFWIIWDKKKQAWQDKIAQTLVVKV